jgi:hypothetical protein
MGDLECFVQYTLCLMHVKAPRAGPSQEIGPFPKWSLHFCKAQVSSRQPPPYVHNFHFVHKKHWGEGVIGHKATQTMASYPANNTHVGNMESIYML